MKTLKTVTALTFSFFLPEPLQIIVKTEAICEILKLPLTKCF